MEIMYTMYDNIPTSPYMCPARINMIFARFGMEQDQLRSIMQVCWKDDHDGGGDGDGDDGDGVDNVNDDAEEFKVATWWSFCFRTSSSLIWTTTGR